MTNPFRSEADAFRFLIAAVVYLGLIAAAAAVDSWLGLAVFLALSGAVAWRVLRRRSHTGFPT